MDDVRLTGFAGATAIVTGGATSIGRAVARAFHRAGTRVVVADIAVEAGEALERELGAGCRFLATDLRDDGAIQACVAAAVQSFGGVDFVVNVACAYVDRGVDSPRADWILGMDVNLIGGVMMVRAALPYLRASPRAAVVNFASISGRVAQAGRWIYPASKAAVEQVTRSQALDLAPQGVRVNAVMPGWTWSGVMDTLSGGDKAKVNRIAGKFHVRGKIAEGEEVADAVLFLCCDQAAAIAGAVVPVDGGYAALGPEGVGSPIGELLA